MAFAEIEPFGGPVEDLRAGLGPATTVNMNRVAKEGEELPPAVSAFDFYPWHAEPKEGPLSQAQIDERIRNLLTPPKDDDDGD